jgi:hypothetical protein
MSKQTAVEWLVEQFSKNGYIGFQDELQAKAMEKEQIVEANISGMEFIPADPSMYKQDAEQYYNETYGGQDG